MLPFANLNALWAYRLMEALAAGGVKHLVLSPGSRSTPLAIAAESHPALRVWLAIDERTAGFFALGLARGAEGPVALACTSGTAAANYHPAVIEASLSGVPLVVVTADRPARLRQLGAPQTIDQIHLYGHAVRRFCELGTPEATPQALRALARQVAGACAAAVGAPAGPVHLNVPFDEPLAPIPHRPEQVQALASELARPVARVAPGRLLVDDADLEEAAERLAGARRPVLVAGPGAACAPGAAGALAALALAWGMPIIADVGSQLRGLASEAVICCHADAYVRAPGWEAPDLVLLVGGAPTAKGTQVYLQQHAPEAIALGPDAEGRDPEALAVLILAGEVADAARRLAARAPADRSRQWASRWRLADAEVASRLEAGSVPISAEAEMVRAAIRQLAPEGLLCLSNSLPIRHADSYAGHCHGGAVHVFRGANGIDGVTSASLGLCAGTGRPTLLVTGDLAFLHDLGGLHLGRHLSAPCVVLVINNDGGGIFSYLPIASATPHFEALFGTPHGLGFEAAGALFGAHYQRAEGPEAVAAAVAAGFGRPGLTIIEAPAEREATAAAHKAFSAAIQEALGQVRV